MAAALTRWWEERRVQRAALVVLILLAMGRVLGNGMVADDVELIQDRALVHGWSGLWRGFRVPYWPLPHLEGLFRPLTIASVTVQWHLGGGSPLPFHIVNLLLYVGVVFALWAVLARWVSAPVAFAGAVLFAIHPIHTEVVAQAVNQTESLVALVALLLVLAWYRFEEGTMSPKAFVAWCVIGQAMAIGTKEHAIVLPALMALVIVARAAAPIARLRAAAPALVGMTVVIVLFWTLRTRVLGGLAGAAPALGLPPELLARGSFVMGVVPTWIRLFFWPAHLRVDYNPLVLPPWADEPLAPVLGVLALSAWTIGIVWGWRRERTIALGLLWMAIAIAPVSNVLIPSGTLLGERTLFLATVGLLVAVAAAIDLLLARGRRRPVWSAVAVLVVLGTWRSARRMPDWANTDAEVWSHVRDSPESFRAHLGAGTWAFDSLGDRRLGEWHLKRAIELYPADPEAYQALGNRYRADGLCEPALALYLTALRGFPGRSDLRVSAVACLLYLARYSEASALAQAPEIFPNQREWFARAVVVADSAARVHAPPGRVAAPPAIEALARVGRE